MAATEAGVWLNEPVTLELSSSGTGYKHVCQQNDRNRVKPFYAKITPDGGGKQRTLPGSNSATAREAACKLAYFRIYGDLPAVQPRKKRRTKQVCARAACGSTQPLPPSPLPLALGNGGSCGDQGDGEAGDACCQEGQAGRADSGAAARVHLPLLWDAGHRIPQLSHGNVLSRGRLSAGA